MPLVAQSPTTTAPVTALARSASMMRVPTSMAITSASAEQCEVEAIMQPRDDRLEANPPKAGRRYRPRR